jgi:trk system potassium uptake protein TrkH
MVAAILLSSAGLVLDRARRLGRLLLIGALAIPVALGPLVLLEEPLVAFILGMGGGTAVGAAFLLPLSDAAPRAEPVEGRAVALRWSAYVSIATWIALLIVDRADTWSGLATAVAGFSITLLHALRWVLSAFRVRPTRSKILTAVLIGGILGAAAAARSPASISIVLAVTITAAIWIAPSASALWSSVVEHPARLLVATFAALCFGGTALLALPVASSTGSSVGVLDAMFTAVSAVCVTGLIVLDTPNAFGFAGEAIIALLIQLGGLGIMTFYSAAFSALGKRLSLRHESAIAGAMSIEDRSQLFGALGRVLRVTLISEALGAAILFLGFLRYDTNATTALWRAIFTSISAFCNAGFALQSDSLVGYNDDPLIVHTVGLLIIVGGLSPIVVSSLPAVVRRRRTGLQVQLILATSAILLFAGFFAFAAFEWTNTLSGLSVADRLHNAWFQSLTTRTAGFNSIDTAAMRPATQTLTIALMFIGGSPGSTAGGVKTTTFAILALAVGAALRRRSEAAAFGRRVGHATIYKAAAVFTLGVLAAIGALVAIQLTQAIDVGPAVFEVVSALATVGLSVGATGMLDSVGKVIVIACMFAGRVGPLTLFLFLTEQGFVASWGYPEEEVDVG